ncbi:UNVERIFIED_CONTAM: flagellar protein FlgJ [Acetivibrio alkalicellulosi]
MDIGRINDKTINNSLVTPKEVAGDDEFEKRLLSAYGKKDEEALKKVCKEFEGLLLGMIYKQMKATVPKGGLIPPQAGREIFESMLDDKIIEEASKNRSYGLAEDLYKQLSRNLRSIESYTNKKA